MALATVQGYGYGYGASRAFRRSEPETSEDSQETDGDSASSCSASDCTCSQDGPDGPAEVEVEPGQVDAPDLGAEGEVASSSRRRNATFQEVLVTDTREFTTPNAKNAKKGTPKNHFEEPPTQSKRQRTSSDKESDPAFLAAPGREGANLENCGKESPKLPASQEQTKSKRRGSKANEKEARGKEKKRKEEGTTACRTVTRQSKSEVHESKAKKAKKEKTRTEAGKDDVLSKTRQSAADEGNRAEASVKKKKKEQKKEETEKKEQKHEQTKKPKKEVNKEKKDKKEKKEKKDKKKKKKEKRNKESSEPKEAISSTPKPMSPDDKDTARLQQERLQRDASLVASDPQVLPTVAIEPPTAKPVSPFDLANNNMVGAAFGAPLMNMPPISAGDADTTHKHRRVRRRRRRDGSPQDDPHTRSRQEALHPPTAWQLEWFGHPMGPAYQTHSGAPFLAMTSNIAPEPISHHFSAQAKPAPPPQASSTQAKRVVEQETLETPRAVEPGADHETMQYDEALRAAEMSPDEKHGKDGQPQSQETIFESAPHEFRKENALMEAAEASSPSTDPEIPEPRTEAPEVQPEAEVADLSKLVAMEQVDKDETPGKEQKEHKEQAAVVANVLHGASAETKETFEGLHATAEPKRNGKRPKAAAKKSAAMPRKKQGIAGVGPLGFQGQQELKGVQGSPQKETGNQEAPDARDAHGSEGDWEVGDGELQLGLRAALGLADSGRSKEDGDDEVIVVDDGRPVLALRRKRWPMVGWPDGKMVSLAELELPKAVCWQPSKLKSTQLRPRQLQRTPGPGVGTDGEGEGLVAPSDPQENGTEAKRGLRLAGEWRPPPPLRLPSAIRQWSAAAYRGTELAERLSSRQRKALQEEVGPEYRIKLVGLLRDLESRSSGPSEPVLLRMFWSTLSVGERIRFTHDFPQFRPHLPREVHTPS